MISLSITIIYKKKYTKQVKQRDIYLTNSKKQPCHIYLSSYCKIRSFIIITIYFYHNPSNNAFAHYSPQVGFLVVLSLVFCTLLAHFE